MRISDWGDQRMDLFKSTTHISVNYRRAERRAKTRIGGPFPTIARGLDVRGEPFETEATLDDLSAGGLRLRLSRTVSVGAIIFLVTRLTRQHLPEACVPRVALRGLVLRSELQADGSSGVAVAILRHRFLAP